MAGADSHFTASLSAAERASYNAAFRNRVAYKHAHSQQNPEADWGRNTLQAVVLAFYVPNESHANAPSGPPGGKRAVLDRRNTLVIVSSVSNGGGATLAAAEQDQHNLIDGVAVTEPNAQPITAENVPAIAGDPVDTDRIVYARKTLYVPDGCLRCRGEDASGIAIAPQSVATAAGSPASAGRNCCAGDGGCGSRRGWRAWRERRRRSRRRADSRART